MPVASRRRAGAQTSRSLTLNAERAAGALALGSGLNLNVVRAWIAHESNWGRSRLAVEQHNYLGYGGPGNFRTFTSPETFAARIVAQLQSAKYQPILASRGRPPAEQIAAIAASPWDASHYGGAGGPNLLATYRTLVGSTPGVAPPASPAKPPFGGQPCYTALRTFASRKCPDFAITAICDAYKAGKISEAQAYAAASDCGSKGRLDDALLSPAADVVAGLLDDPVGLIRRGALILAGGLLGFYALHLLSKQLGAGNVPNPILVVRGAFSKAS